ncbi:MAG: phytoene/squalene synthase family protein, partial [Steroidobacteraceae bacterium]
MDCATSDDGYQGEILPRVSRTFALTIPQLPPAVRKAVTNAYLLCRIADTIEDEPALGAPEATHFLRRFAAVVRGAEAPAPLALELSPRLSGSTLAAERELVDNMERVVRITDTLGAQRAAIRRCLDLMCDGMPRFRRTGRTRGMEGMSDLDSYCYYVAGVVGEMLTDLFCGYSPAIGARQAALADLAASFGQGLQMTNILKDFWEDRRRGACWLPREVFARHGLELAQLTPQRRDAGFPAGMRELIAVAHGHLRNALDYALLIPRGEPGIRRFCLWAIGLAVLTLRKIAAHPQFTSGAEVKVSHRAVFFTSLSTSCVVRHDRALRRLFEYAARG